MCPSVWLRDRQTGMGLIHEKDGPPELRSKESPREFVGELAVGVVLLHEGYELRKVVLVQLYHVRFGEAPAELPQVRASPDLFDQHLGGRVVLLEANRIVAAEVYPRTPAIPAGSEPS